MIDLSAESPDRIADWIELLSAAQVNKPLSLQRIISISEDQARISPNITTFAFRLLEKRAKLIGSNYPFTLGEHSIATRKSVGQSIYLKLLLLTPGIGVQGICSGWNLEIASQLFEEISEHCLKGFFGPNTGTVNFGYPSRRGRPSDFDSAVKWLSELTKIRLGRSYRPPRRKDGGVDLFVWKSFRDGRPGVPIMLVQCTIKDDFINKIGDIDIKLWSSWLSSDIEPLVSLAIPGIVSKEEIWSEIVTRGILLDRVRLVEMSNDSPMSDDSGDSNYLETLLHSFGELVH